MQDVDGHIKQYKVPLKDRVRLACTTYSAEVTQTTLRTEEVWEMSRLFPYFAEESGQCVIVIHTLLVLFISRLSQSLSVTS